MRDFGIAVVIALTLAAFFIMAGLPVELVAAVTVFSLVAAPVAMWLEGEAITDDE